MVKRALAYIAGAITSPRQAFTLIIFDAQGLSVSFLCLGAIATAWAAAAAVWALAGFQPWATPWLAIPASQYYFWQALFSGPVFLAAWVFLAGFVQLTSPRSGGGGSFEATAKLLALCIAVPKLVSLIPAWLFTLLALGGARDTTWWLNTLRAGSFPHVAVWLLMVVEAVWMTALVASAIRAAHKLRLRPSLRLAVPAVLLYYGFMLIFFR